MGIFYLQYLSNNIFYIAVSFPHLQTPILNFFFFSSIGNSSGAVSTRIMTGSIELLIGLYHQKVATADGPRSIFDNIDLKHEP